MSDATPTLAWLLDPVAPAAFVGEHFERRPLVVNRRRADYYGDLLDVAGLDRCLGQGSFSHPEVNVVAQGRSVDCSTFAYPSGLIDLVRLYQQFDEGGTIIVSQLELRHAGLALLCRQLEAELSTRLQANIYLTPAGAMGFRSHYDSHDVVVLQLAGTKQWRLFDTPIELPHRGQHFAPKDVAPTACTLEFELGPGDLCYLPRGVMHEATTTDETSLHITLGLMHTSWTELLLEALAQASLRDPELRRALPLGFARPDFDREVARATFDTMIAGLAEGVDFDQALDHFADDLVSTRHPVVQGQLEAALTASQLAGDAQVGGRPELLYRIVRKPDAVVLRCYGSELQFPLHAEAALRFALTTERYCADDIPGDLDADGKRTLVRRLVREGVLAVR
ncbi:MAG: cupin domain-containing protein [Myxococcota bacterium]